MLRFAGGTTAAFVLCEVMGWYPSFLAPLFAGMLLANLPVALPPKIGLVLVVVEGLGAYSAYILTSSLVSTPVAVFGVVGLVLFTCFAGLAQGKAFLPLLLTLISFATIPILTISGSDPVREGWAQSYARPGGNVTGLTYSLPELAPKRLELLKEASPALSRVALLVDPVEIVDVADVIR